MRKVALIYPKLKSWFEPYTSVYHIDKNKKGWRNAKCARCIKVLPKDSIRIWVLAKFFSTDQGRLTGPSARYFCPRRKCVINWMPYKLELAPPFLEKPLLTSTYQNFTTQDHQQLDEENFILESEQKDIIGFSMNTPALVCWAASL